jgi:uncharacterized SAM-binding protein YcdF (DUF218 family)
MESALPRWNLRRGLIWGALICLLCSSVVAGPLLVVCDDLQQADAIIVIGGDHKLDRVRHVVGLHAQGYAPIVIISAGTIVLEGEEQLPEAEVMRRRAVALGLSEAALLLEDESQSTFQNAYYTKAICDRRGFQSVLLVTSAYHSRRARRVFQDVFGPDISVSVQPAHQSSCALCWWFKPDQFEVVLYEYYNWGRYWLGIRFPSEKPPDKPVRSGTYTSGHSVA